MTRKRGRRAALTLGARVALGTGLAIALVTMQDPYAGNLTAATSSSAGVSGHGMRLVLDACENEDCISADPDPGGPDDPPAEPEPAPPAEDPAPNPPAPPADPQQVPSPDTPPGTPPDPDMPVVTIKGYPPPPAAPNDLEIGDDLNYGYTAPAGTAQPEPYVYGKGFSAHQCAFSGSYFVLTGMSPGYSCSMDKASGGWYTLSLMQFSYTPNKQPNP
jgi:hypothetical protein